MGWERNRTSGNKKREKKSAGPAGGMKTGRRERERVSESELTQTDGYPSRIRQVRSPLFIMWGISFLARPGGHLVVKMNARERE